MTRALIRAALVIALVTAAVFLLIRLVPGDPVVMVLGEHAKHDADHGNDTRERRRGKKVDPPAASAEVRKTDDPARNGRAKNGAEHDGD